MHGIAAKSAAPLEVCSSAQIRQALEALRMQWLIQILPPLGSALLVIVPNVKKLIHQCKEKQTGKKAHVFIIITAIIMLAATIYSIVNNKFTISDLRDEHQNLSTDLKAIRAENGDLEAYKAYVSIIQSLNREWAKIEAEQLEDRLPVIEKDTEEQKRQLINANERLSSQIKTKCFPVVDKLIAKLDAEMEIIGKNRPYEQKNKSPILTSTNSNPESNMIRSYLFYEGSHLFITEHPAIIDNGQLRREFGIFVGFSKPEQDYRPIVSFRVAEKTYWFSAHNPIQIDGYEADSDEPPITDKVFLKKIEEGGRQAVIYALREVPKK